MNPTLSSIMDVPPQNPRPIVQHVGYPSPSRDDSDEDEEERTNYSVITRRLNKRRKTNQALVANPFGDVAYSKPDLSMSFLGNQSAISDGESDGDHTFHKRRHSRAVKTPECDLNARQRCYEYIHSAIDALWAEYCDSTSYAESIKYMPNSPISDPEDLSFTSSGEEAYIPNQKESDKQGHSRSDSISMQPQSQSLMRQKKRLVDAKYLLSHFVAAPDMQSSISFWKVWDQLKYTATDLVEGDEDEAEEVIEQLESGRCI